MDVVRPGLLIKGNTMVTREVLKENTAYLAVLRDGSLKVIHFGWKKQWDNASTCEKVWKDEHGGWIGESTYDEEACVALVPLTEVQALLMLHPLPEDVSAGRNLHLYE